MFICKILVLLKTYFNLEPKSIVIIQNNLLGTKNAQKILDYLSVYWSAQCPLFKWNITFI